MIIRKYNLPHPIFCETWGRNFYRSNNLSWPLAHFVRCGKVDPAYISIYINQLAHAVNTFRWDFIYNKDETSARINNVSKRTLAPVETEDDENNCARNDKECFSMIGKISKTKTYRQIFLYMGVDAKNARNKLNLGKDINVWVTETNNSWINERIMLKYLNHLHSKFAQNNPCALVLDVYPAHRTKEVIKLTGKLNIEIKYLLYY